LNELFFFENISVTDRAYEGRVAFRSFQKAFILNTSQRQADEEFRNILDSLSDDAITYSQYSTLMNRHFIR
jgi:hypothetical protein